MEKLQAAVEKARNARNQDPDGSQNARPAAGPAGTPRKSADRQQDLWSALKPFDIVEERLLERRIVTREAGPSSAPFDILRTKILLQMRQNGWKRLAITSPMPNSGKTTVACNLALGTGRQKDLRTILMDMDLRDPSVDSFFGATPPYGMSELLTGQVDFCDQALLLGDNVACSMAQRAESDPARLLLAEETTEVINRIDATYAPDLMIFDLPSMLVNDDTRAFLKNVDCALIVARANFTRYSQFDACEREIGEQTNVLGTVLNAYMNTKPSAKLT